MEEKIGIIYSTVDGQTKKICDYIVDLLNQKMTDDGRPLEIVSSLEPEAYGIDMNAIQL
jgi:menaquinone-dependent protoporphyrinogen IX oxidase